MLPFSTVLISFHVDGAGVVDVVGRIEGAQGPLSFSVLRREKADLDDDTALCRFREEIVQAREVFGIPLSKVEFVAAAGISAGAASLPRSDEPAFGGGEIIAADAEGFCRDLDVASGKESRVIQTVGL